jgi:hypothetical protein
VYRWNFENYLQTNRAVSSAAFYLENRYQISVFNVQVSRVRKHHFVHEKTWTDVFTIVHDRALMEAPADHVNGEACQLTKRKKKW